MRWSKLHVAPSQTARMLTHAACDCHMQVGKDSQADLPLDDPCGGEGLNQSAVSHMPEGGRGFSSIYGA